jgi:glycerophosphoryl diester phosphodiesterase
LFLYRQVLKQNVFPVLQLCYNDYYEDPRTQSISGALSFAKAIRASGVVASAIDFMKDSKKFLKDAKSKSLALFVFTEEKATTEDINALLKMGLNGVIFDGPERLKANRSFLEVVRAMLCGGFT